MEYEIDEELDKFLTCIELRDDSDPNLVFWSFLDIIEYFSKKSINPFILKLQDYLINEAPYDTWKEIFKYIIDMAANPSYFKTDIEEVDDFTPKNEILIDYTNNIVYLLIWLFENAYIHFKKMLIKKPFKKDAEILRYSPKSYSPGRKKIQLYIYQAEEKLIRELDPKRLRAAEVLTEKYKHYYYLPKNVTKRLRKQGRLDEIERIREFEHLNPDIFV